MGTRWAASPLATEQLASAIDRFVAEHRIDVHRDGEALKAAIGGQPHPELLGPTMRRREPSGMILHQGELVHRWGDTARVEWSFSVAKSFVSTMIGLAVDQGLVGDLDDRVSAVVSHTSLEARDNQAITWRMLQQQTSSWVGTLWGKPDWVDDPPDRSPATPRGLPGKVFAYNDVRVNFAALCATMLWRRPLRDVLAERIMGPIGASDNWRWHGYRDATVDIDGLTVPVVPGGSHWGGGLWISTEDLARFGLLHARAGQWDGRSLVSARWIEAATTPSKANAHYGLMWWLGTARGLDAAPPGSFFALGGGSNYVWISPDHQLVIVARWIDSLDPLLRIILPTIAERTGQAPLT